MSSTEEDPLDDFLAYSGSEYDPSSYSDDDSFLSSAESDSDTDRGNRGKAKKRRLTRQSVNKKKKPCGNNTLNNAQLSSNRPVIYKPFDEFMKDVVFSLSGFVNPLRSDLRSKALEMGALYKPDWNDSCTHLVCAFRNTPKYQEVRGNGKIVNKEWIEDCYSTRKRFPWRRYALDNRDRRNNESDDEIHEAIPDSNPSSEVHQDDNTSDPLEDSPGISHVTGVNHIFNGDNEIDDQVKLTAGEE